MKVFSLGEKTPEAELADDTLVAGNKLAQDLGWCAVNVRWGEPVGREVIKM